MIRVWISRRAHAKAQKEAKRLKIPLIDVLDTAIMSWLREETLLDEVIHKET